MGEHEHRVVERRVRPHQPFHGLSAIPWSGVAAEHVAAHHRRADVGDRFLDDRGALVDLAAGEPVRRAPGGEREHPLVQAHAADPERVVDALLGSGDEAVERHRDPEAQLGHVAMVRGWLVELLPVVLDRGLGPQIGEPGLVRLIPPLVQEHLARGGLVALDIGRGRWNERVGADDEVPLLGLDESARRPHGEREGGRHELGIPSHLGNRRPCG